MRFIQNQCTPQITASIFACFLALCVSKAELGAQGIGLPNSVTGNPQVPQSPNAVAPAAGARAVAIKTALVGNTQTPPSLQNNTAANAAGLATRPPVQVDRGGKLPQSAGQEHRIYDLRPYTGYLTDVDQPQQAIIDWILRETGTDVWFSQPFGFMSADRDQLSIYHTREMHEVVAGVVNRFVAGEKEPQVLSMRVMTVGNPNWRSRAHMLMQHVNVDSPGVQAWLVSKENAALIINMLRQRTDFREVQALDLVTYNGQTQKFTKSRGRNYVRNIKPVANGWPPYEPETGELIEGYRLEVSPLLSVDGKTIDCTIKVSVDQVDKLKSVELDLPLPNGQFHRANVDVPQVVSWRLDERFRWPSDMILLLSCGVVASPEQPKSSVPYLNLDMLTGTTAGRAEALLAIAYRGRASENLSTSGSAPQISSNPNSPSRGRY